MATVYAAMCVGVFFGGRGEKKEERKRDTGPRQHSDFEIATVRSHQRQGNETSEEAKGTVLRLSFATENKKESVSALISNDSNKREAERKQQEASHLRRGKVEAENNTLSSACL